MKQFFCEAMKVAETCDVSTPEDGLVLYSVSFLPTKENRELAFQYVKEHSGFVTIENTLCGSKLVEMSLSDKGELTDEEIASIWATASQRMIKNAKGNITAFVKGADLRSVFCRVELVNILENPLITTINGEDKHLFASKYIKYEK